MHMGALHPIEQWLTLILAFGPFVLLGIVLWVRGRQDAEEDMAEKDMAEKDMAEDDTSSV